jgi:alpha-1,3-rhamnosyltransferase
MNNPLVSILLPSYNHEKFIEEAILSIMNQTYKNIELIVIDDGSSDNSPEIIEKLQKEYDFFYEKQSNQGLIKTLEKLLLKANGEYISLFSSDDVYTDTKIEKLIEYLLKNKEYDLVYSKIKIIDQNSNCIKEVSENYKKGFIFNDLLCGNFFINGLGVLIKTDIYIKYKRKDSYIDDLQLWLQVAKDHNIGFVDEYLTYYRIHNNHLSSNLFKMQRSEFEILSRYKNENIYFTALNNWNIRWFGSFARCDKMYAIKEFLPKIIKLGNLFNKKFYKSFFKLFVPCFVFKRKK